MKSSASKIQLAGFDDLFQTSSEAEANGEQVREVPLTELFPFKDHPFQVRDDEAMQKTVASIARSGVLSPGIVRPRPGFADFIHGVKAAGQGWVLGISSNTG